VNEPVAEPVNLLLLCAFFYIVEELQDLYAEGIREYILGAGWMNLMDWLAIFACLLTYSAWIRYFSVISAFHEPIPYPLLLSTISLQINTGVTLFCIIFKGLKFTMTIPVMCSIGNCFAHVMVPIALFTGVVCVLQLAFGMIFHLTFCTSMVQFETLPSAMFSMFRGLLGDMDVDGLLQAQPFWGPMFYICYVTAVLFIALTILIAIVCYSYDEVKDVPPKQGLVLNFCDTVSGYFEAFMDQADKQGSNASSSQQGQQGHPSGGNPMLPKKSAAAQPGGSAVVGELAEVMRCLHTLQDQMSNMQRQMDQQLITSKLAPYCPSDEKNIKSGKKSRRKDTPDNNQQRLTQLDEDLDLMDAAGSEIGIESVLTSGTVEKIIHL